MRSYPALNDPFAHNLRFAFGSKFIQEGDTVLDIGCGSSGFGVMLLEQKGVKYVGIDRDEDRVRDSKARAEVYGETIKFFHVDGDLTFVGIDFDVVTMFDVLEHINDQDAILRRIWGMLKSRNGCLIVTVPRKHIFSFLDPGNVKFRFPRINRWLVTFIKGKEYYDHRFLNNPFGLVGDVEKEKGWHQHFSAQELCGLLKRCGFEVIEVDGSGLFGNFFNIFSIITGINLEKIRRIDDKIFDKYQLYVCAKKSD